jgi:hypothetical protein
MFVFVSISDSNAQKRKTANFEYEFSMEGVPDKSQLVFSDSILDARFIILEKAIAVNIENKSDIPIQIVWDKTNYIHGSEAKKVMHTGVKYADRNQSQPNTIIPPGTRIQEEIVPTENVSFYSGGTYTRAEWFTAPLFPLHDGGSESRRAEVLRMKGFPIGLFVTMIVGKEEVYYNWKFYIENIKLK